MYAVSVFFLRAAVLATIATTALAQPLRTEPMRGLNNEVLRFHALAQNGTADTAAQLAIERRAAVLAGLIESDPAAAISFAFPAELLVGLAERFPQAAARLETQGTWAGTIESFVLDSPNGEHRTRHVLRTGDGDLELFFAGDAPEAQTCGRAVVVQGVRLESRVAVTFSAAGATATTTTGCTVTGDQKTAVLLVTFPGLTPPAAVTPQAMSDAFFGTTGRSLDNYWREASYGKTSASGAVYGWFTLPSSYSCTTTDALRDAAITAAAGAGVNFQNYTRLFLVVPDMGCGWSGAASLGCATLNSPSGSFTATTTYLNWNALSTRDSTVALAAHEGGHNLGLAHANSRAFGTEALGPVGSTGVLTEYADGFSAMSNGGLGHYAASQKADVLGWLTGPNVQTVQSSGTWTLQPLETATAGAQALKVLRGTGGSSYVWVEYRQPIGNYDNSYYLAPDVAQWYTWANQVFTGALIHYVDSTTGVQSHLLDFTPTSANGFYDPALAAGQTWTDPYSNLSITVQSATASGLTVAVNYGAPTANCVPAAPGVTLSPVSPSVYSGSSVSYTMTVANQDSAACPASTFTLASVQPTGWLGQLSSPSVSLSPGGIASVTLTEGVPSGTTPGTYALSASAANGSYQASAPANASVVAPPSLTDTTAVSATTVSVRQTVAVTSTVMYGTSPVAGVSVAFKLTKADGSKVSGSATTDSKGKAVWSYKVTSKDAKGSATVSSTVTYQSQTVTSNSASFQIQ